MLHKKLTSFFIKPQYYAETHYKFQLPASPLHKKVPGVFIDGSHLLMHDQNKYTLWLVIKNAHLYPVRIEQVVLKIKYINDVQEVVFPLDETYYKEAFHFIPLPITLKDSGDYHIQMQLSMTCNNKSFTITNSNLPGIKHQDIAVRKLKYALPYPENFYAGETHSHSWHSSDPVEFGAPLHVLQNSASETGLKWFFSTDHSYDFYYKKNDYMCETSPRERWLELKQEADALTKSPIYILGEEVSCGNALDKNVHMICAGHKNHIAGLGDGGRRWLNNYPDLNIREVIDEERKASPTTLFFAAHPRVPIGILERFIFRRGEWNPEDIAEDIRGLQFWNGSRDEGFRRGRELWIQMLLQGRRILPLAGNDAHGDLNQTTGVLIPLFKLKQSKKHIFGKVRTVLPFKTIPDNTQNILEAFSNESMFITDGPGALIYMGSDGLIRLEAHSNDDWGNIQEVVVFCGNKISRKEEVIFHIRPKTMSWQRMVIPKIQHLYFRMECRTDKDTHALTSAIFPTKDDVKKAKEFTNMESVN
jgi:hypothetical protein